MSLDVVDQPIGAGVMSLGKLSTAEFRLNDFSQLFAQFNTVWGRSAYILH